MDKDLPFRTDGIYATKINSQEEFPDHKPTKLGSMWKIAQGKREYDDYRIIYFKEKYSSIGSTDKKEYSADLKAMHGEIFMIADDSKTSSAKSFKNVQITSDGFTMSNENLSISGNFRKSLVRVSIHIKSSGETDTFKMRFIPWI